MKSSIISEVIEQDKRIFKGNLVQLDTSMFTGSKRYIVLVTKSERSDTGKFNGVIIHSEYLPDETTLVAGFYSEFIAGSFKPFNGIIQIEG